MTVNLNRINAITSNYVPSFNVFHGFSKLPKNGKNQGNSLVAHLFLRASSENELAEKLKTIFLASQEIAIEKEIFKTISFNVFQCNGSKTIDVIVVGDKIGEAEQETNFIKQGEMLTGLVQQPTYSDLITAATDKLLTKIFYLVVPTAKL